MRELSLAFDCSPAHPDGAPRRLRNRSNRAFNPAPAALLFLPLLPLSQSSELIAPSGGLFASASAILRCCSPPLCLCALPYSARASVELDLRCYNTVRPVGDSAVAEDSLRSSPLQMRSCCARFASHSYSLCNPRLCSLFFAAAASLH